MADILICLGSKYLLWINSAVILLISIAGLYYVNKRKSIGLNLKLENKLIKNFSNVGNWYRNVDDSS